jgi:glycosyltransferase involved in cell wall biosynthesis
MNDRARPGLSLAHRAWRVLPRAPRRAAAAALAAALAPRPGPRPSPVSPGLAVAGELSRASGLGEGARLMLAALEKAGLPRYPVGPGHAEPPPCMPLVLHVNAPYLPAALLRLPRGLVARRLVIGYWAWELPTVPPSWRRGFDFVHEVWVPSRFTLQALEPLLPGRVRLVPHPVAVSPPSPSRLTRRDFGFPDHAVVVLVNFSLASSFERKNPLGAIAAFRAAFADRDDRRLVIKIAHADHFPDDRERLLAALHGSENIRLDTRLLPKTDVDAMTECADIVLSLHRSEGFGLVAAEAMLLGRPVVATGWSGTLDFMDAASAALVDYRLIPARDPRGVFEAPGAVWADPDIAHAASQLRALADDPAARAALGARGRAHAAARLTDAPLRAALDAISGTA